MSRRRGRAWFYNLTPKRYGVSWDQVQRSLQDTARDPAGFDNALATMWFHIDDRGASNALEDVLAPAVRRVFLWPVTDELEQLKRFEGEVLPQLDT